MNKLMLQSLYWAAPCVLLSPSSHKDGKKVIWVSAREIELTADINSLVCGEPLRNVKNTILHSVELKNSNFTY